MNYKLALTLFNLDMFPEEDLGNIWGDNIKICNNFLETLDKFKVTSHDDGDDNFICEGEVYDMLTKNWPKPWV